VLIAAEPVIGGPPQGKVIGFGIIKSLGSIDQSAAPETLSGTQRIAHGPKFGQHTTRIPAKPGISFWVLVSADWDHGEGSVELKKVVRHPQMKNSRGQEEDHYTTTGTGPVTNGSVFAGAAYTLDRPEELKPGQWTFEIYYHGKKLVSQSFTVYAAK